VVVAAFIVSILAMLAAAASGFYAHRQAKAAIEMVEAANATLKIEQDKRLEERTPEFVSWIEYIDPPRQHRLHLYLASPRPLSALQAKIVPGQGVSFLGGEGESDSDMIGIARLEARTSVDREVRVEQNYSEPMRLEVSCTGDEPKENWPSIPVDVPLFPNLEERQPAFKCYSRPPHQLCVQLVSQWPLASLAVTIVEGYGVYFAGSPTSDDPDHGQRVGLKTRRNTPLAPKKVATFRITTDESHSPTISIAIECKGPDQVQWPPVRELVMLGYGFGRSSEGSGGRSRRR
jgi:hypothetical protein